MKQITQQEVLIKRLRRGWLNNLRDAVMRMPAAVQVRVAETTQLRQLNGVV